MNLWLGFFYTTSNAPKSCKYKWCKSKCLDKYEDKQGIGYKFMSNFVTSCHDLGKYSIWLGNKNGPSLRPP